MASTNTQSATPIQQAGRSSRGAPHRNAGLRAFLLQCAVISAVSGAVGALAIWFLIQPAPTQAMIGYGAVVTLCGAGIVASLRRKARGR